MEAHGASGLSRLTHTICTTLGAVLDSKPFLDTTQLRDDCYASKALLRDECEFVWPNCSN